VTIQVFPAAQLGDERALGEGLRVGTIDLMWGVSSMVGQFAPEFNGLEAGYLFRDRDHQTKVHHGPIGDELNQRLIQKIGVRVLAFHFAGERHLTTSTKAVRRPEDLKGMLIRVPQLEGSMQSFKALGASVTGIAFNEVYMALKMGLAEGQENPLVSIYAMKFHEVQKYLSLTAHILSNGIVVMNNQKYLSLPPEAQKALLEEARAAGEYTGNLYAKQGDELIPELKKFLTFIEVNKAEFQQTSQRGGMDEWYTKQFGAELYKRIQETK
jgi:tripartite ATP-independent transporter DctP family solute receptor